MKIIIAILTLWIVTGTIYTSVLVGELRSDLYVEKQLFKVCTAELMWLTTQLEEVSQ